MLIRNGLVVETVIICTKYGEYLETKELVNLVNTRLQMI